MYSVPVRCPGPTDDPIVRSANPLTSRLLSVSASTQGTSLGVSRNSAVKPWCWLIPFRGIRGENAPQCALTLLYPDKLFILIDLWLNLWLFHYVKRVKNRKFSQTCCNTPAFISLTLSVLKWLQWWHGVSSHKHSLESGPSFVAGQLRTRSDN